MLRASGGNPPFAPPSLGDTSSTDDAQFGREVQTMMSRIQALSEEVKTARMQQHDTRASIGKIMEFLSQVYHQRPNLSDAKALTSVVDSAGSSGPVSLAVAGGGELASAKRMRIGGARPTNAAVSASEAGGKAVASDAAVAGVVPSSPQPPPIEVRTSGAWLPPLPLAPGLSRTPSLGAQVASALPNELRDIALQLVDSTELQDRTLQEIKDGARQADAEEPMAEDLDAYLWDFLETSQVLDEAQDGGPRLSRLPSFT